MKKHIAAACLLGTALVSAPVFAQDSSSTTATPSNATSASQAANAPGGGSGQFLTQMDATQWRGSKLVGVDVFGSDNSKIGDINEVIVDRNGQAKAIVIGVGGFLGIGEKNVAIAWDKVQWTSQAAGATASSASTPSVPAPTSRDIAQTTTGAPVVANSPATQTAATGGATLSTAPGEGVSASAPAASTPAVTAAPSTSSSASGSMTGSSSSASASSTSTNAQDYPDRAVVAMSKQDLQNAPEFKYASQAATATGGAATTNSTTSTR